MPTHLESICEDHWFSPQLGPFIYFLLSEHLGFSLRRQQVWKGSQSCGWDGELLAWGGSERGEQGLLNYSADFGSNATARGLRNHSHAGKAFTERKNQRRFNQIKAIMQSEKCPLSTFPIPFPPHSYKCVQVSSFSRKKEKKRRRKKPWTWTRKEILWESKILISYRWELVTDNYSAFLGSCLRKPQRSFLLLDV